MTIKPINACTEAFIELVHSLRTHLSERNQSKIPSFNEAKKEAASYFKESHQIFGAFTGEILQGFIVLKCQDGVFWVEWLVVRNALRRQGIASSLFHHAETIAKQNNEPKLYIWVHPDNTPMLKFLKHQGYDALNLIEVTKQTKSKSKTIQVFDHTLTY